MTAGTEQTIRRNGERSFFDESKRANPSPEFIWRGGFIWISAKPIVDIVQEVHAADAGFGK